MRRRVNEFRPHRKIQTLGVGREWEAGVDEWREGRQCRYRCEGLVVALKEKQQLSGVSKG